MVGDGLNDARRVFEAAYCAANPGPGLARSCLRGPTSSFVGARAPEQIGDRVGDVADQLHRVIVRTNLWIGGGVQHGSAGTLLCLGWSHDALLLCAILMPAELDRPVRPTRSAAFAHDRPQAACDGGSRVDDASIPILLVLCSLFTRRLSPCVLFVYSGGPGRDPEHADRLSLMPLEDDLPALPCYGRVGWP